MHERGVEARVTNDRRDILRPRVTRPEESLVATTLRLVRNEISLDKSPMRP